MYKKKLQTTISDIKLVSDVRKAYTVKIVRRPSSASNTRQGASPKSTLRSRAVRVSATFLLISFSLSTQTSTSPHILRRDPRLCEAFISPQWLCLSRPPAIHLACHHSLISLPRVLVSHLWQRFPSATRIFTKIS